MTFEQRKCAFTGRPISHIDNASVQLTFVELDSNGRSNGKVKIYDVCGKVRHNGTIDGLITDELLQE